MTFDVPLFEKRAPNNKTLYTNNNIHEVRYWTKSFCKKLTDNLQKGNFDKDMILKSCKSSKKEVAAVSALQ